MAIEKSSALAFNVDETCSERLIIIVLSFGLEPACLVLFRLCIDAKQVDSIAMEALKRTVELCDAGGSCICCTCFMISCFCFGGEGFR